MHSTRKTHQHAEIHEISKSKGLAQKHHVGPLLAKKVKAVAKNAKNSKITNNTDYRPKSGVPKPTSSIPNKNIDNSKTEPSKTEKDNILKKIRLIGQKQELYKVYFHRSPLFQYNCKNPYTRIDRAHKTVSALEDEEYALYKKGNITQFIFPLKALRREVRLAKKLWDTILIAGSSFAKWRTMPLDKRAMHNAETQCQRFKTELENLDVFKHCDAYVQLAANIEHMLTCIQEVNKINNHVLRECVWKEMMKSARY